MSDDRYRPWIKQRMSEKEDGQKAISIWQQWKLVRHGSKNVARAIRIYNALLKGDADEFHKLMKKYFPGYGLSLGMSQPTPQTFTQTVLPRQERSKPKEKAKIIIDRDAYNSQEDEDDEFGFGNLEIG